MPTLHNTQAEGLSHNLCDRVSHFRILHIPTALNAACNVSLQDNQAVPEAGEPATAAAAQAAPAQAAGASAQQQQEHQAQQQQPAGALGSGPPSEAHQVPRSSRGAAAEAQQQGPSAGPGADRGREHRWGVRQLGCCWQQASHWFWSSFCFLSDIWAA